MKRWTNIIWALSAVLTLISGPAFAQGLSRRLLKFSGGSGDILRDVRC